MVKQNLGAATGIAALLAAVAVIAMVEPANAQTIAAQNRVLVAKSAVTPPPRIQGQQNPPVSTTSTVLPNSTTTISSSGPALNAPMPASGGAALPPASTIFNAPTLQSIATPVNNPPPSSGGTNSINGALANQFTTNLAGAELAPSQPTNWVVDSYHPPQGSTGPGQNLANGAEVNQTGGAGGGGSGGNPGGSSSSGSAASNIGSPGNSSSGGPTTVASLDTSRGGGGGKSTCSDPNASTTCSPEGLANVAPAAGGGEYIVTARAAQAGDVSAGTYVFGTNEDGSPRVMQTTPVLPKTVDAAGLNSVIARSSADRSVVAGTVSQITAADGAKTVAVDLYGDKLMSFAVDKNAAPNIVDGEGKAIAQGGEGSEGKPVIMLAAVAEQVVQSAINLGGLHQANGYLIRDGQLILVYLEPGQNLAAQPESAPPAMQIAMQAN